jgi:hypothetical protein
MVMLPSFRIPPPSARQAGQGSPYRPGHHDGNEFHGCIAPGKYPGGVTGLCRPQAVLAANAAAAIAQIDVETERSRRGVQAAVQPRSLEPD